MDGFDVFFEEDDDTVTNSAGVEVNHLLLVVVVG
jgi:hypothetical protein